MPDGYKIDKGISQNLSQYEKGLEKDAKRGERPIRKVIIDDVNSEIERAKAAFPGTHSFHHGLGVIEEEVFELKMEVYKQPRERDKQQMRREAVQVAATAIRFIEELL